jgi:flagellar hook-associated protein 3 FlgL
MRVTGNLFSGNLVDQLGTIIDRNGRLQKQASTGQRITNPGDDPSGMQSVLGFTAESKSVIQYKNNIDSLKDKATAVYAGIKALRTVSDRASEIAMFPDGMKPRDQLLSYAKEVTSLIETAVTAANSTYKGDYLFGGTATGQQPFTVEKDANGWIVSVSYNGNDQVPQAEITAGDLISVQVPGANASDTGARGIVTDKRAGADLFNHLVNLQNHLRDGVISDVNNTDRIDLGRDEDNIIFQMSDNAATQARLNTAASIMDARKTELDNSISGVADVDITQTIIQLSQAKTAYDAALQTGASLLQQSLLNYLR